MFATGSAVRGAACIAEIELDAYVGPESRIGGKVPSESGR